MLAQKPARFTPLVECALLFVELPILRTLDLSHMASNQDVLSRLGAGRSRAYELKSALEDLLVTLQRKPGRPPKEALAPHGESMLEVAVAVRSFLARHPGSMVVGERRNTYTAAFIRFVLTLLNSDGVGQSLTLEQAEEATGVPLNTLKSWLTSPPAATDEVPPTPSIPPPTRSLPDGVIDQIITLYERWKGSFTAFVAQLQQHRIYASTYTVRQILQLAGLRTARPRTRKTSDPEALRGAFETFFPGAQFVADGKTTDVTLGEHTHRFCWELVIDTASGALVGFAVRDAEDSRGLLDAYEHGKQTSGKPPLSLLRDNLPANHSPEVEAVLAEDDVISMPSTAYRPENKAHVEGQFGLFAQTMPPIDIPSAPTHEQARQLLFYVLFAYAAGRNQAPRRSLGGRSAASVFRGYEPTEEEEDAARTRLKQMRDRIRDTRRAEQKRLDPICRQMLDEAFLTLGLEDPEGTFIPAIARHGLDAALEAIAIFSTKQQSDTLPEGVDARYLLGIARNVAHRNEDEAVYAKLVELRERAGDLVLAPLREQAAHLKATLTPEEYIYACMARALDEPFIVDRQVFRQAALLALAECPVDVRRRIGPLLARMVATQYALTVRERDQFIADLAKAASPLADS